MTISFKVSNTEHHITGDTVFSFNGEQRIILVVVVSFGFF